MLLPTITARITVLSFSLRGVRNAVPSCMYHFFESVHGDSQIYNAIHALTPPRWSSSASHSGSHVDQLQFCQAIVQHVHFKSLDIDAVAGQTQNPLVVCDDLRQGEAIHQFLSVQACKRLCNLFCSPHQHSASDGGPHKTGHVVTIMRNAQQFVY